MVSREQGRRHVAIEFGAEEWEEEVGRFGTSSAPRALALSARRAIESGNARLTWKRCRSEDAPDGTSLPGCVKLYVPLDKTASDAPYGFVFRLQQALNGSLSLSLLAFGERHPRNRNTRTVYERAHKRLHGHYPLQR